MRRRSERKKSTDASSPAVTVSSRRSVRRRKSSEKNAEDNSEITQEVAENVNRASSEEPEVTNEKISRRGRRRRTPVSSPTKRKNRRTESPESKIEAITEEENNGASNYDNNLKELNVEDKGQKLKKIDEHNEDNERAETMETPRGTVGNNAGEAKIDDEKVAAKEHKEEVTAEVVSEDVKQKEVIGNSRPLSSEAIVEEKAEKASITDVLDIKEDSQQDQEPPDGHHTTEGFDDRRAKDVHTQKAANKNSEITKKPIAVSTEDSRDSECNGKQQRVTKSPIRVSRDFDSNENSIQMDNTNITEQEKSSDVNNSEAAEKASNNAVRTQRKRKWLTKKAVASSKTPILAISTDSLKGLIADVHPVPLSDVRLDSSPEIEEVASEREEGEKTPSPKHHEERSSLEKTLSTEKPIIKRTVSRDPISAVPVATAGATTAVKVQRSPSPARNKTSNVLFITNLVRPFTVMQLKSLLARTGKIVENGFWIDRIKSKCYVQYETEDEAIETRHALHGVRWPVSNPKCLNVDFGKKVDMDRAVETTKDDAPKLGQESKDNIIVGSGWSRGERAEESDRKSARPVREWDVGKKDNLDRDREKNREVLKRRSRDRDLSANRENEKSSSERKARNRERRDRSRSISPVRKVKKENEPPLRLLDDLFRKTKAAPCIYWLPLTPEQIAEKEAQRQKRIIDRQERIKQLELEREKEREKDREKEREKERENRNRGNDRERDRDRRNRSNDRRRSRSRDRRRY